MEYWECVGDDLCAEGTLSFADVIKVGADETVVFAWISCESREARDQANEKIMQDERFLELMNQEDPVVDFQRMAQGGFRELVHR